MILGLQRVLGTLVHICAIYNCVFPLHTNHILTDEYFGKYVYYILIYNIMYVTYLLLEYSVLIFVHPCVIVVN